MKKIKFKDGNNILYGQDFSYHRGVPKAIDFYIFEEDRSRITIIADGHGFGATGCPLGKYGNGSIYIQQIELEAKKDQWFIAGETEESKMSEKKMNKKYILYYGHRRLQAIIKLGWTEITAKINLKIGEEFKKVPIDQIKLIGNIRSETENLASLMKDIQENGLLHPIGLVPLNEFDEIKFLLINTTENVQRKSISPVELGKVIKKLHEAHDLCLEEIAVKLNISLSKIKSALDMYNTCPEKFQKYVGFSETPRLKTPGSLTPTIVKKIIKMSGGKKATEMLLNFTKKNNLSLKKINIICFLIEMGLPIEKALTEYEKYKVFNPHFIINMHHLNKMLKKHNIKKVTVLFKKIINGDIPATKKLIW